MEEDHQLGVASSDPYSQGNMFEPLVEAVPGFRPEWEAFVAHWTEPGEPSDLPNYLLLGDLARYLVERLQGGETREITSALEVCELWILQGDGCVKAADTVGLLEELRDEMLVHHIGEDRILPFLAPECLKQWKALNAAGHFAGQ